MSTLMWREKPEINPEIDLGFLPEALHVKSHKPFILLNDLCLKPFTNERINYLWKFLGQDQS